MIGAEWKENACDWIKKYSIETGLSKNYIVSTVLRIRKIAMPIVKRISLPY